MKTIIKTISILIILVVLLSANAMATTSVSISSSTINPGNTLTIWGTTDTAHYVSVKITDDMGNIVCFEATEADGSGNYSTIYTVPSDMAAGNLYITTGSGNDTASSTITVIIPSVTPERPINPQTGDGAGASNNIWWTVCLIVLVISFYLLKIRKVSANE